MHRKLHRDVARAIALGIAIDTDGPLREFIALSRSFGVSCSDAATVDASAIRQ